MGWEEIPRAKQLLKSPLLVSHLLTSPSKGLGLYGSGFDSSIKIHALKKKISYSLGKGGRVGSGGGESCLPLERRLDTTKEEPSLWGQPFLPQPDLRLMVEL